MQLRRAVRVVLALLFTGLAFAELSAKAAAQETGDELGAPRSRNGAAPSSSSGSTETVYPAPSDAVPPPPGEVPAPPDGARPPSSYGAEARYPNGEGLGETPLPSEGVRIPSRLATRLRVLDADFAAISGRGGALVNGILSIVTGGISITIGILVDDEFLSPYLYVFGGAGVARGVIDLLLTPNPHDAYINFSHMPMRTTAEVEERLRYGETELESAASRSRIGRILDASLNIGVGLAVVPIYLGPNDFVIDPFGAFIIIGAGISVVSGVISLLTRTEAERRWSGYEELRERLDEQESADRGVHVQVAGGPLPGGGALSIVGTF